MKTVIAVAASWKHLLKSVSRSSYIVCESKQLWLLVPKMWYVFYKIIKYPTKKHFRRSVICFYVSFSFYFFVSTKQFASIDAEENMMPEVECVSPSVDARYAVHAYIFRFQLYVYDIFGLMIQRGKATRKKAANDERPIRSLKFAMCWRRRWWWWCCRDHIYTRPPHNAMLWNLMKTISVQWPCAILVSNHFFQWNLSFRANWTRENGVRERERR